MNIALKAFPSPPFHGALCWSCRVPWALVFTLLLVLCFALLWCESGERLRVKCSPGLNYHFEALSHSPDSHGPPAGHTEVSEEIQTARQFKGTHRARAHDANIFAGAFFWLYLHNRTVYVCRANLRKHPRIICKVCIRLVLAWWTS